ncbi:MAG: hypothetical protein JWM27_572 [Gemmatimonadetes bacterium]|nr:hypothetical protein [Gemmatimonadota bacterium]
MSALQKWFVFTIVFALVPFGCSWLLQQFDQPGMVRPENSPELLFFSIMVCASALGELSTPSARTGWRRPFLGWMFGLLLVAAVLSAVLFGVYTDHSRKAPGRRAGIECSRFVALSSTRQEAVRAALGAGESIVVDCREWEAVQTHIFRFSIGLAILLSVAGTLSEGARITGEET